MKRRKRPRKPPISQPGRLQKYSDDHLSYEIEMLCASATLRSEGQLAENIRAELFALHLRNLIVFLYPDYYRIHPDDVSAHHFLAARGPYEHWARARGRLPGELQRAKDRADTEVAHLTARRIAGKRKVKEWRVRELVRAISIPLGIFAKEADPARMGQRAAALLQGLERLAASASDGAA